MYVYEATLEKLPGSYHVELIQFDECGGDGGTVKKAIENAALALKLRIAEMLESDQPLPRAKFGKEPTVAICVEVDDAFVNASKCVTINEAARMLGVTHGRVCQLLDDGLLEAYQNGGRRMVTKASIEARKEANPQAGRPRLVLS